MQPTSTPPQALVEVLAYASPLGPITLAARGSKLWGLWFDGQRHMPVTDHFQPNESHPTLTRARAELEEYFAGRRQCFDTPLDWEQGTAFQRSVWQRLLAINWGQHCSYADLALAIGRPTAVRAVGAAVGRNPWSIVVPCHRVLGRHGALTGYAGGLERKSALLQLEQVLTA